MTSADGVTYHTIHGDFSKQTLLPGFRGGGFLWEALPQGVYEGKDSHRRIQVMAQHFLVEKFAPTSGAAVLGEAIFTPAGISCYVYLGYVDLSQVAFDELEKRWTEFVHGLNDIKRVVAAQAPTPMVQGLSAITTENTGEPTTPESTTRGFAEPWVSTP